MFTTYQALRGMLDTVSSHEADNIMTPVLQIRKMRFREVTWLIIGKTAIGIQDFLIP